MELRWAPSEVEGGFTLGSDGVRTLGREEGSLSIFGVRGVGGVGGVCTARRRMRATCK